MLGQTKVRSSPSCCLPSVTNHKNPTFSLEWPSINSFKLYILFAEMDFAFVVLKICRYFWYFSGEPPTCPMVFFRSDWAGFYLPRISRISWSDIHVLFGHVTSNLSMHSLIRDEDLRVPDWSSKQIDTCFYPNILRHNQNRIGEIWACAAVNHSKKKIKILYSQVF